MNVKKSIRKQFFQKEKFQPLTPTKCRLTSLITMFNIRFKMFVKVFELHIHIVPSMSLVFV
jgi:hypothetical protein